MEKHIHAHTYAHMHMCSHTHIHTHTIAASVREAEQHKPDSRPHGFFKNSNMPKEHRGSPPAGQEWEREKGRKGGEAAGRGDNGEQKSERHERKMGGKCFLFFFTLPPFPPLWEWEWSMALWRPSGREGFCCFSVRDWTSIILFWAKNQRGAVIVDWVGGM